MCGCLWASGGGTTCGAGPQKGFLSISHPDPEHSPGVSDRDEVGVQAQVWKDSIHSESASFLWSTSGLVHPFTHPLTHTHIHLCSHVPIRDALPHCTAPTLLFLSLSPASHPSPYSPVNGSSLFRGSHHAATMT